MKAKKAPKEVKERESRQKSYRYRSLGRSTTIRVISRAQIREILIENPALHQVVLEEGILGDAWEWIKKKGVDAQNDFKSLLKKLSQEWSETKESASIVSRLAMGESVSESEKKILASQALDLVKGIPIAGLFMLPGGGLAVAAMIKIGQRLGVDVRPSSFK